MIIVMRCIYQLGFFFQDILCLPFYREAFFWLRGKGIFVMTLGASGLLAFSLSSSERRLVSSLSDRGELVTTKERGQASPLFEGIEGVFSFIDFSRIGRDGGMDSIIKTMERQIPRRLRRNFRHYAPMALEMARKYKVDPFWAVAVMWVESSFRSDAVSPVGARGLMQVMPATGGYLAKKLWNYNYGPHRKGEYDEYTRPSTNVEMGVYYLSYLTKKFDYSKHNYSFATIAYNMGPGQLRYLLRKKFPIRQRSSYLKKVRENYFTLLHPFQSDFYEKTANSDRVHKSKNRSTIF